MAAISRMVLGMQLPLSNLLDPRPARSRSALWMLGVTGLVLGAFAVVGLTGGSPNALNNLGYGSIAVAAYRFTRIGGVAAGLFFGLLLGPVATFLDVPAETPPVWAVRLAAYVGIGFLLGSLFATTRAALQASIHARERLAGHHLEAMLVLARSAEAKDETTGEHLQRVQAVAEKLARGSGIREEQVVAVGWAAMLHDIGKLHVPDHILSKPAPLDPVEWQIVRRHPEWGAAILGDSPEFALAQSIARAHHENFDGSGYPYGLRGDEIAFEARIVRIADAFDAMTNDRPYRKALQFEEALEQLKRHAGTLFDPELANLAIEVLRRDPALVLHPPACDVPDTATGSATHQLWLPRPMRLTPAPISPPPV